MKITDSAALKDSLYHIKAFDIMSRFAITTTPDTSIADLAHVLMRSKISGVPVVNEKKEIVGIITATDLFDIMKNINDNITISSKSMSNQSMLVKDFMTGNVFTIAEDTPLMDIIRMMSTKDIHTLPVTNNKDIVGIIGRRDVLNAFYSEIE